MCAFNYCRNSEEYGQVIDFEENKRAYKTNGVELFLPQTNGEISESIVQNWTQQAYECYCLEGNCKNCSIGQGSYSFVCQMTKIVKVLLKLKGKPNPSDFLSD